MAQQNSPLTRTNMNSVTSVSPLEHESSPKNDSLTARAIWKASHREYREARNFILSQMTFDEPNKHRGALRRLTQSYPLVSKCLFGFDSYHQEHSFGWVIERSMNSGKTGLCAMQLADKFRSLKTHEYTETRKNKREKNRHYYLSKLAEK
ncbi:hypothetical protein [Vibrio harveyi]|uniref:hypothetical protein n=1 Tax=Vibrio harveyi TaxID=669 RepID=UPI003BB79F67